MQPQSSSRFLVADKTSGAQPPLTGSFPGSQRYGAPLRSKTSIASETAPVSCHELQRMIFGSEIFDPAVYYSATSHASVPLGRLPVDDEGLHIPPRAEVSFNSLLNAFFETYWFEHTPLRKIALVLETSGSATLTLHRAGHSAYPIQSYSVAGGRTFTTFDIDLDMPTPRMLGLLYLTITDVGENFTLHCGEWSVRQPPNRSVALDIVFCTFNKVPFIRENLRALAQICKDTPQIHRIHVIDQGSDSVRVVIADDPELESLRRIGDLRIVEQENLGGAGGFTRGIMESLASDHASHILLLDDDIVIEPQILQRLINLLGHARDNPIIGGQMLDLYRPAWVAACAETFDFENGGCQRLHPFDFDCRQSENLVKMCEITQPTYNAWWFCCFPREIFERHGLPLPFFIRTDDAEFGVRATCAGEKLIQMPGICVWHKPFDAKQIAWMSYYSLRNDLILCNIAAPGATSLDKRYHHHFWNAIKAFRYDEALATCLAIEHYILGPEIIFSGLTKRHREVLAALASVTAPKISLSNLQRVDSSPRETLPSWLPSFLKDALCIYWTFIHGLPGNGDFSSARAKTIHYDRLSWPWTYGERGVVVHDPHERENRLYQRDSRTAWKLAGRFLKAMHEWRRNEARVRKAYAESASTFSTWESWEKVFGRKVARAPFKEAA